MKQMPYKTLVFFACLVYAFTCAAPGMASTIISQKKEVEIDSSWQIKGNYYYEFKVLTRNGSRHVQHFISHLQSKPDKFKVRKIIVSHANNGTPEKSLNPADITPQKLVEVEYTVKNAFPGFQKLFADFFSISQPNFAQKAEYTIKFPDTISFTYRIQQDGVRYEKEVADNVFRWSATRVRELDLMVTTAGSWDHIARHYQKRYRAISASELPSGHIPGFMEKLKDSTEQEKILSVLGFLNGQMTYKARTKPEHALIPCPPVNVLNRGWGDCKDMALLGALLLRKLNVDAFISLEGKNRKRWAFQLPDPFIFNHALIALEVEGNAVYYDYMAAVAGPENDKDKNKNDRRVIHIYL